MEKQGNMLNQWSILQCDLIHGLRFDKWPFYPQGNYWEIILNAANKISKDPAFVLDFGALLVDSF